MRPQSPVLTKLDDEEAQIGESPAAASGTLSAQEPTPSRPATTQLVTNAVARAEAQGKIQEAIEVLRTEEWRPDSIEKELVEEVVIGELELISSLLGLEAKSVDEVREARAKVEQAVSLLERAGVAFLKLGYTTINGALALALVEIAKALVT